MIFPNQDIEYRQPSTLARKETKDLIHVSAVVFSASRWELINDFLSQMKAYLIDVWDIPERAGPKGFNISATLVLIKTRFYALLCALYFFLPDPGIVLCFRF